MEGSPMATCATRTTILGMPLNLDIRIADALGNLVDPDAIPQVEIKDNHNAVIRAFSVSGVSKLGVGLYRLTYTPPTSLDAGLWSDNWNALISGQLTTANLIFTVLDGSSIEVAGAAIGDAPCVSYTQAEITGINILLAQLKCRLKNNAMAQTLDAYGQKSFVDCPIFTDDELLCFLNGSLSEFNQTPHFTGFGYDSPIIYERNAHVIVEGAHIIAIGAQMLIEAGREFTVTDNGITMQPPPLSTTLNTQFGALLTAHTERLKFIKCSMKPSPTGIGTFRVLAISPAFMRLRHLRQRQII
jgi:hypothetical protein